LLAVHKLDTYTVTGSAVTVAQAAALAPGQPSGPVLLGDVWDALEERLDVAGGFRDLGAATGRRYLEAPDGRTFELTNRGFLDWRPASGDLLELLASWGVKPIASGRYPVPPHVAPDKATAMTLQVRDRDKVMEPYRQDESPCGSSGVVSRGRAARPVARSREAL
jgi:hypothetical protein